MSDVQTETLYSVPKAHCFIGGPSCGKTSALVARAKELASSGQPGGILYVCASKAAVDGVRQQIFDFDIEVKTRVLNWRAKFWSMKSLWLAVCASRCLARPKSVRLWKT